MSRRISSATRKLQRKQRQQRLEKGRFHPNNLFSSNFLKILRKLSPDQRLVANNLRNSNEVERIKALRQLISWTSEREVLPVIKALFRDPSPKVRADVLFRLFHLDKTGSIPLFKKALRDSSPSVRLNAVHCLSWLRDSRFHVFIREKLDDPDKNVREAVRHALTYT